MASLCRLIAYYSVAGDAVAADCAGAGFMRGMQPLPDASVLCVWTAVPDATRPC